MELFSALGLAYDPNDPYTIQTLIDLKIPEYIDLINAIFKRALGEANHLQQLATINEIWTSKLKFKLAKNFPIQLFKSGMQVDLINYLLSLFKCNFKRNRKIRVSAKYFFTSDLEKSSDAKRAQRISKSRTRRAKHTDQQRLL